MNGCNVGFFGFTLRQVRFSYCVKEWIFLVLCFGWFSFLTVLKVEGFFSALLSGFCFLPCCSIFLFCLSCFGNLGWCFARKSIFGFSQDLEKLQFFVTSRCSITSALRAYVGQFLSRSFMVCCANISIKPQLKNCRWTRRYVTKKIKMQRFGQTEKAKA